MVETNSTDEERASSRAPGNRPERHESPPREYVGEIIHGYIPFGNHKKRIDRCSLTHVTKVTKLIVSNVRNIEMADYVKFH